MPHDDDLVAFTKQNVVRGIHVDFPVGMDQPHDQKSVIASHFDHPHWFSDQRRTGRQRQFFDAEAKLSEVFSQFKTPSLAAQNFLSGWARDEIGYAIR